MAEVAVTPVEGAGPGRPRGALPASRSNWALAVDRFIEYLTEPLAVVLIVINVALLAGGVFSRYVLLHALAWTDELASIFFSWPDISTIT